MSFDMNEIDTLMTKSIDALKLEFDKLRTGQASASMCQEI